MDAEHGHVERDWNDYQAKQAGEKVLEPQAGCNIPGICKQDPELQERQAAYPCDGEQANPLHTDSGTKSETSRGQPEPPRGLESLGGPLFMLICEACPGECGNGSKDDERRVEEDQTGLGNKGIVFS